jgi:hypothetical protein
MWTVLRTIQDEGKMQVPKPSVPLSAGRNSPPVFDGRVAPQCDTQLSATLLWSEANYTLQPLFDLFQRFIGHKLSLLHAQLIKIEWVRS